MAQDIHVRYVVDDRQLDEARAKLGLSGAAWDRLEKDVQQTGTAARRAGDDLATAGRKGQVAANDASKGFNLMGKGLGGLSGLVSGAFSVAAVLSFGKAVVDAVSEYQKFRAVLTTALGNEALAAGALAEIQAFAAATPFAVNEITEAYVRLTNQGFQPTKEQLRQIGDLAASTGKSFNQAAEAILDAQTGEFERLKEFGIIARKSGDEVSFTFKGVKTTVDASAASIRNYIVGLGDLEGVSGSMAGIAETLGGKISNLGDGFDRMLINLGQSGNGPLSFAVQGFTNYINLLADAFETAQQKAEKFAQQQAGDITAGLSGITDPKVLEERIKQVELVLAKARAREAEAKRSFQIAAGLGIPEAQEAARLEGLKAEAVVKRLAGALEVARKKLEGLGGGSDAVKGKLETLRADLKTLTEEREKIQDGPGADAFIRQKTREIEKIQEQIRALTTLEKVKKNGIEAVAALDDKQFKAALDAFFKSGDEQLKALDDTEKALFASRERQVQDTQDTTERETALRRLSVDLALQDATTYEDRLRVLRKAGSDYARELAKTEQEFTKAKFEAGKEIAVDAAGFYLNVRQQQIQQELSELQGAEAIQLQLAGDNEKAKARIRNEFAAKERAVKREQANNEKLQAVFSIGLSTAQAIMKTGATLGYPAAIPFQIAIGALGAAQLAFALSRKPPAYARGTKFVEGEGTGTSDSVHAMLSRGERVVTAEKNRLYTPALDAIHDGRISPNALNQLVADFERYGAPGGAIAVPVAPGASLPDPDAYGRAVAAHIGDRLGVSIVVDGAGVRAKRGRQAAWQQVIRERYDG